VPEICALTITWSDEGGAPCLRVAGELDVATADRLLDDAQRFLTGAAGRLVLDLRGVVFLDSVGIRALLLLRRSALGRGVTLDVVAHEEPVGRLLRITSLDGVLLAAA
jgi:anti-sigma B factor antagonist